MKIQTYTQPGFEYGERVTPRARFQENEETRKQIILKEFKGLRVESDTERGTTGF